MAKWHKQKIEESCRPEFITFSEPSGNIHGTFLLYLLEKYFMKGMIKAILVASLMTVLITLPASAQKKPERTSSAKAYYGHAPVKSKYKFKKKKRGHNLFDGQMAKRNRRKNHA